MSLIQTRALIFEIDEPDVPRHPTINFITVYFHNNKQIKILPDTTDEVVINECIELLGLNGSHYDWYLYIDSDGKRWLTPSHP